MKNRNFLTTNHAASMIEKANGLSSYIYKKDLDVEQLKGLGIDFISFLRDPLLSNFLIEQGINSATLNTDPEAKISVRSGDVIYLVNPGVKLHSIREKDSFPPYANVSIKRIIYVNDPKKLLEITENDV